MSSEKIIDSISEDIYKESGIKERIMELARRIRDKDLYFLENDELIKNSKQKRKGGEFKLFCSYIKDSRLRVLYNLGLTLRGYEKNETCKENAKKLIEKTRKQYKIEGLHITYFAQNILFSELLNNLWERELTEKEISSEIEDFLSKIDNKAIFINRDDDTGTKIEEILIKIRAHSPEIFIISSMRSAMHLCKEIKEGIADKLSSDYNVIEYSIDDSQKEIKLIYFFNRKIKI